jgi:Rhomboid family
MSSGADLFVVCKQCGSEVSPYITECPYCGSRLRRRAPKLPREREQRPSHRSRIPIPALGRLRRGEMAGVRGDAPPYATIALVAASCLLMVLTSGHYVGFEKLVVGGPLRGDWWKLLSYQFAYLFGFGAGFSVYVYAFCALLAVGVFGWLLERRHGVSVVLAVFFGAGVSGALVELAVYPFPLALGANAGALGLLAAWAVPDLLAARAGRYYDGDLLGAATMAAVLLVLPFVLVLPEASWLAGATGGVVGLVLGYGISQTRAA